MSGEVRGPNRRTLAVLAVAAVALVAVGGLGGYWFAGRAGMTDPASSAGGKDVLYWYDPMVPDQHFDQPGKSPFMDMQLVPRYAGETQDSASVRIAPGVQQNLGVRLAVVERQSAQARVLASGTLTFNERDVAVVQAKAAGFVEHARRLAIGDLVRAGDVLVEVRVPAWSGAIAEHLSLRRSGDPTLAIASRQRLVMLAVPASDIEAAERSDAAPKTFSIRAPITGAVTALGVKDGMTVSEGMNLVTVNGVSPVWLTASVPQGVAGNLRQGGRAVVTLPAYPAETFEGKIDSILPQASMSSRTIEVRIALPNPGGRLRPGMTAEVDLSGGEARSVLTVPSEAVIRTGRRTVVIVGRDEAGQFTPTEVQLGASFGDRIEIVAGLEEDQQVVASGQFLIDSEASLSGVLARLAVSSSPRAPDASFQSTGRVTAIDASGATIAHEPVTGLNWPSMTMKFAWGSGGQDASIKPGEAVDFSFSQGGAGYVLGSITPKGDER